MKYWLDLLPLCVALLKVQLFRSLWWWYNLMGENFHNYSGLPSDDKIKIKDTLFADEQLSL